MIGKIIIIVIVAIIAVILFYYTRDLIDEMRIVNSNLNREWDELKALINNQFGLVKKEIDADNQDLINIINREANIVRNEDFINAYYDLEKIIERSNFSADLLAMLKKNSEEIEYLRQGYNDDALKMNKFVNSFPTNFLAIILRYKKWVYFRSM